MLSALFVSAIPVSAGNLSYTTTTLPSDIFVGITSAGTVINDYAISADGMTVYAATSIGGMKSVNGGRSWLPLANGLTTSDMVAMAPDNPDFVVFLDAVGAFEATVSINGGSSFNSLGSPQDLAAAAATAVTSLDVSKTVAGINYIAVGGTIAAVSGLFYFDKGAAIPRWRNAITDAPFTGAGYTATTGTAFSAVKFSPNFDIDGIAYVVESDFPATSAYLHAVSFQESQFNAGIGLSYAGWIATGTVINAGITAALTKADIVFDPLYSIDEGTLRTAYVSLFYAALGGVYRFTDFTNSGAIAGSVATYSLALNSTGTVLVAGAAISNTVYTNTAPTSVFGSFVANRLAKRIGVTGATDYVKVGWSGANVVASKQGVSGAFAMSTDNGLTFNDISLVNTALTNITDVVVSADGTKRYVISNNAATNSIFYWDGTVWERTGVIANGTSHIAKASPTNFDVLYVADNAVAGKAILYTNNAGKTNWLGRTGPGLAGNIIVDIVVESDSTIYVATNGATDVVGKSTFYGLTWVPGSVITPTGFAATGIASLTLVSANNVIAGGNAGESAYTTNGGMSWIPLAGIVGGTAVYTAAASLDAGSNIYAVTAADTDVYTWTMGTSLLWTSPGIVFAVPVGTALYVSTGITLVDGVLYRVGAIAATDTEISRTLNPAAGAFATWASVSPAATLGINDASRIPNVLKASAGNQLWFVDSAPAADRVLSFTDTLAPATAVPVITFPADGALLQVNRQTGVAYQTTISWNAAALATAYAVDIALDSAFTNRVVAAGAVVFPTVIAGLPVNVIIGPGAAAPFNIGYQPGQTYYWRVRAVAPFFSAYSDTMTFSIMPAQGMVPEISSPENGTSVTSLTPGFSWTPIGGASSYAFELSVAPDFTTTLYSTTAPSAGAVIPTTVTLERGKTYFWRVRALTPTLGDWSAVANFTVAMPVVTTTAPPQVTPTLTVVIPPGTTIVTTVPPATNVTTEVNPSYIWAIIIIGAVLVIAVIVLIVRTRRSV